MDTSNLVLGLLVLVVSIIANSVLNVRSSSKQGWGDDGGSVFFCMALFGGALWFGYRIYGWLGVVVALVAQVVGMAIGVSVLSGRTSSK